MSTAPSGMAGSPAGVAMVDPDGQAATIPSPAAPRPSAHAAERLLDPLAQPASTLRAEHLFKRYGARVVVNDVHLAVGAGEVVGLLGPNGPLPIHVNAKANLTGFKSAQDVR